MRVVFDALRKRTGGAKVIEIRKVSGTQLDGVSLYLVFCNGMVSVKKVYARDEKEAEGKVRAAIENA